MHNVELSPLDSFSSPSAFQESALGSENFVVTPSSVSSLDHIAPAADAQHAALQALMSPILDPELTNPSFRNFGEPQPYFPHLFNRSSPHRHHVRLSDSSSRLPNPLDQYDFNTIIPSHHVPVTPLASILSGFASGTNPSYGSPLHRSTQPIPPTSSQYLSTHQPTDLGDLSISQQIEFDTICSDYLTMLSPTTHMDSTTKAETIGPVSGDASPPGDEAAAKAILEVLEGTVVGAPSRECLSSQSSSASPSYKVEHELSAYLTSPLIDSPWEEDFLTTPALLPGGDMGIDIMASPALLDNDEVYTNAPLFGDEPLFEPLTFEKLNADRRGTVPDSLSLSPSEAPGSPTSCASPPSSTRGRVKKPAGNQATKQLRRKSMPTGTRKNVTPESLIPVDAPIQDRKYVSESATSRKELPAVFARKRKRASTELEEEEDLLAAPPTTNELSAIEAKRRQNTLAARRSRKRKLEHQRDLESTIENERVEKDAWKQRALAFEAILNSNGIRIPPEFAIQRM
jgi:hypothetical protein